LTRLLRPLAATLLLLAWFLLVTLLLLLAALLLTALLLAGLLLAALLLLLTRFRIVLLVHFRSSRLKTPAQSNEVNAE
jgi:hypothetical protein